MAASVRIAVPAGTGNLRELDGVVAMAEIDITRPYGPEWQRLEALAVTGVQTMADPPDVRPLDEGLGGAPSESYGILWAQKVSEVDALGSGREFEGVGSKYPSFTGRVRLWMRVQRGAMEPAVEVVHNATIALQAYIRGLP